MNFKQKILFFTFFLFSLNLNGQNRYVVDNKLFPYSSFDSIVVYSRDYELIKGKKDIEIRTKFLPYRLVDKSLKTISSYYKYNRTLNDKQTKYILKIINRKKHSTEMDCATIYSDYGFVFYKKKEIIGFFEVSLDCYQLLFFPENINFKQAFKQREEKRFLEFLKNFECK